MFKDFRQELMGAVDAVWSERIRLLPQSGGTKDPERQVLEIDAVLRTGDRDRQGMGRGAGLRAGVNADGGLLRIDRSAFPNLELRKGDKIIALNRAGAPVFEIHTVDDRSHLRLICEIGDTN